MGNINKVEESEGIESVKGFDLNLKCRGFQYEIGKSYKAKGEIKVGANGFHAIEGHPLKVFDHYSPATSRYAIVRQFGDISYHANDGKLASSKITIETEITLSDLVKRAWDWVWAHANLEEGSHVTGSQGAASATGEQGAAMASGFNGKAKGSDGCALFLVRRNLGWEITHVWSGIVGRDGIKADQFYTLDENGRPLECE